MKSKKKLDELMREHFKDDKEFIDKFYNDKFKEEIKKRFRTDFPIDKVKSMIDETCAIEYYKKSDIMAESHLKGNPFALLFSLYILEEGIKKQYAIPEPVADIIKLIKNEDYGQDLIEK